MNKCLCCFFMIGLLVLFSCSKNRVSEPNYELILRLEGKKYDKLWLRTEYNTLQKPYSDGKIPVTLALEIEGKSRDGYDWSFMIPDSIYTKSAREFIIKTRPFDFKDRKEGFMLFSIENKDTASGAIEFTRNKIAIDAKYKKTVINDKFKNNEEVIHILTDTFVLAPTFVYDIFDIESITKDSNLDVFLKFPDFAKLPEVNYEDELQKRVDYVKKHPDSKSLFYRFSKSEGYKNRDDMKLVFNNFSDSLINTTDGKQLLEYLTENVQPLVLDSIKLKNTKTRHQEPIINDPSKFTLVIFSASWCGPCHAQIPLLKSVYADLGKKLDMVYISIDQINDVDRWNDLMTKEEIPWRSLFADDKYKGLKENYTINGIPFSILIHPDGVEEKIDVRFSSDKDKLYTLISEFNRN